MKVLVLLAGITLLLAACSDGEAGSPVDAARVLAPIESVDIRTAESSPPQYFLDVVSGLPSGCATFDRYDLQRTGDRIEVSVWNLDATPEDGACTAIYGTIEHHVALGTDFVSGKAYTVHVNGTTETFVAQ